MNLRDYRFRKFYKRWSILHSLIVLSGLISAILTDHPAIWFIVSASSFMYYLINLSGFLDNFPLKIGYANIITLIRLIIILITTYFWGQLSDINLFFIYFGVILMDGLDGIVARKFNQTSRAGEVFDMEVDAFFVFILSYMHYNNGHSGIWILIPGGMRYIYEIIFFRSPDPPVIRPPKKIRSTIAVIFFVSLLLPLITSSEVFFPIIIFASGLIFISFGISAINRIMYHFSGKNQHD